TNGQWPFRNKQNEPLAVRHGIGLLNGVRYQARYYRKRSCRLAGWTVAPSRKGRVKAMTLHERQARPAVFYPCRGTPPSSDPPRPTLRGGRVSTGTEGG